MTENQKSLITWSMVLLLAVVTVLVLVCTVPDLSSVERIVYRTKNPATAAASATTASVKTTAAKTAAPQTEAVIIDYPLDVNTATKEQLMTVPGIGEAYADRIITYRDENGPFEYIEDLLNIQGIGEKRLESFSEYLAVME